MKNMKKIISLLLVLILVGVSFASCADPDIPKGMKSATLEGEPFVLYVPEGFTDNTASGVSGAYYTSVENSIMVTARYYTPSDSEMDIEGYMTFCADSYALSLDGFEKTGETE